MKKSEFYQLARDASRKGLNDLRYNVQQHAMMQQLGLRSSYDLPSVEDFEPTAFYAGYNTGGVRGGSCMSRDYLEQYKGDTKERAQFDALDAFLEEHFPNLSLRTIRELEQATTEFSFTKPEWYGNSDDYVVRTLDFDVMVKILQDADQVDSW